MLSNEYAASNHEILKRLGTAETALPARLRQRERLFDSAPSPRMPNGQKALTQMHVQLGQFSSDITGKTGMRMIREILESVRDHAPIAT